MRFPLGFLWGAASAAYQTEGNPAGDGKGPSIWDVFSHKPGATFQGHTGDTACDTCRRWESDLDLMTGLGIPNYRFSLSWPRVLPDGTGRVNEAGLAFYDRLVDGCLRRGIEPWVTLYHWDLPQTLEDRGGWRVRETAEAFANYAKIVAAHFRGRVRHYFTLNEPQCVSVLGYGTGEHAPGLRLGLAEVFQCHTNLMLAHGMAVSAVREADPEARVGLASTGNLCYPDTDSSADIEAARALSFTPWGDDCSGQLFNHQWFLDPVLLGRFPDAGNEALLRAAEGVSPADLAVMRQPLDFLGLNIYHGRRAHMTEAGPAFVPAVPGAPMTAMKWYVTPEILRWGPRWSWERYGLPLYISENGLSCNDKIYQDGRVHDAERIDFLARYLEQLGLGIADGTPVNGYFHWSLTDNFEWSHGYKERFGLIYIDYSTQRRTPKDSAFWYRDVIRGNDLNGGTNHETV